MSISKETVQYVANLARIELKAEELDEFCGQLSEVLSFIDTLKKADVSSIKPTSHILPVNDVFRDDNPQGSMPVDEVLANAYDRQGNFFGVPKIIE